MTTVPLPFSLDIETLYGLPSYFNGLFLNSLATDAEEKEKQFIQNIFKIILLKIIQTYFVTLTDPNIFIYKPTIFLNKKASFNILVPKCLVNFPKL